MVEIGDDAIKKLARLARLPATLDLDHFGKDVRATLRRYCDAVQQRRPHEIRNELTTLWKLAARVAGGEARLTCQLVQTYHALSSEARGFLDGRPRNRHGRAAPMPTMSELSNIATARPPAVIYPTWSDQRGLALGAIDPQGRC